MGQVELDRPAATGLEVDEQRPALRAEHVARVRLAVERLLGAAVIANCSWPASQDAAEERAVRFGERRGAVTVRNELAAPPRRDP